MEKLDTSAGQSMDVVAENIAKLKELFPEILTENKIDFNTLKALLGEEIEVDDERYSFNWHGKAQVRRLAQAPSTGTLRPYPAESIDWDTTQNLFIEGDNLEVLKLLQKSYHKRVKMIYIDPPYNTGKDFVYPDNFRDNIQNYLELTGQVDNGQKLGTNSETSGRYHTDWLNMLYPRLKLARNLLRDDGVIFISIDDNEFANLITLCNEIFGEDNFIETFIWIKKSNPPNNVVIGSVHEYIVAFAKNKSLCTLFLLNRDEESDGKYKNPDNDPRGPWVAGDLSAAAKGGRSTPSLIYKFKNPFNGVDHEPPPSRMWIVPIDKMLKNIEENRIYWGADRSGKPKFKRFLSEVRAGVSCSTLLDDVGNNSVAGKELNSLFDNNVIFDSPKPTLLLNKLIKVSCEDDAIILDFFAGSATTAHSSLTLNSQNNANRRFICVQIPEKLDEASEGRKLGFSTIADISKERIRRIAKKIRIDNPNYHGDLGFKVFKLDSSNLKPWDASSASLTQDLAEVRK